MIFRKEDKNRKPVFWQKLYWMNLSKYKLLIMRFKENFDEDFRILNCNRKARPRLSLADTLKSLYQEQILL